MQPRTRKLLTILWVVIIIGMLAPFVFAPLVNLGALASIAWFVAIPVSIITFRRSGRDQHLQRPGWYRAALIVQLLVAVLGLVTAAHTVLANGRIGLVSIATVQLAVAVMTWRAITRPGPRRAIGAALAAELVPFVALMVDIALDLRLYGLPDGPIVADLWGAFAVAAVFLSWIGAALVCIASIHVFGPATNLPGARAVSD